jgi:hypothetical protein
MKPPLPTVSVRISDAMRQRLENARYLIAKTPEAPASLSDVAKLFLESVQDDTVEASELMSRPTETLLNIRRKWERRQSLSRSEWMALGYYLQLGCERLSQDPELPTADSYASLLEAFVAARALRVGKNSEIDDCYLDYLQPQGTPANRDGPADPEAIPRLAKALIRRLRESPSSAPRPTFVGRNLYLIFRNERLIGIEALNDALTPYMGVLFRIAARGHYLREGKPVRVERHRDFAGFCLPQPPPVTVGDLRVLISMTENNESSMLLDLAPQHVLYPLDSYPVIREFTAMLRTLKPGGPWLGREFFGYPGKEASAFNFCRRSNGIVLAFSTQQWCALRELMTKALALPELQPAMEESALAYGEI